MGKAWNTTDFPTPGEDLQKHRSSIQKQITRLPLDAYWGYQTRKLHTLPELILCTFLTCVCESSMHDLCVTSSDMQGEMWLVFKRWHHWNPSCGSSSQTLFSVETTDSRKYICVHRLNEIVLWIGHFTVVCLVARPWMQARLELTLALIQTSLLFTCKCKLVSIRTTWFAQ